MGTKLLIVVITLNFSLNVFAYDSHKCAQAFQSMNWIFNGFYVTTGTSSIGDCSLIGSTKDEYIRSGEQKIKEEIAKNYYGENIRGIANIFFCSTKEEVRLQSILYKEKNKILEENSDHFTEHIKKIAYDACSNS